MAKNKTLSIQQAASTLRISTTQLRELIRDGKIPTILGRHDQEVIRKADITAYASEEAQRQKAQRQADSFWQFSERPNGKPLLVERIIGMDFGQQPDRTALTLVEGPTAEDLRIDAALRLLTGDPDDDQRTITSGWVRVGLRPSPEQTIIHTENPEVEKWLARRGITGRVTKGDLQVGEVRGMHLITGLMPVYLLTEAASITVIRAYGCHIRTATCAQLERAGAELVCYNPPTRKGYNIWE